MPTGVVFVALWGFWAGFWACFWFVVAAPCFAVFVAHSVGVAEVAFLAGFEDGFPFTVCFCFGALAEFLAFAAIFLHPLAGRDVLVLGASSACGVSRR